MSTENDGRDPGEGQHLGEPSAHGSDQAVAAPEAPPGAPEAEAQPVEHFQAAPAEAEAMPVEATPEDIGAEPVVPEAPAIGQPAPEAAAVTEAEAEAAQHDDDEDDAETVGGSAKNEMVEIAKTIFFALLIAFVLRVILFQPFTIPSASMEPNLYQGDYIIVTKWSYGYSHYSIPGSPPLFSGRIFGSSPKRGDIVVFRLPRSDRVDYIKRVIGLPGDKIQMRNDQLYINGVPTVDIPKGPITTSDSFLGTQAVKVQETLPNKKTFLTQDYGPNHPADDTAVYTVPEGCYFMMGDNRDNSVDSRFDPQIPVYGAVKNKCGWDPSVDAALGGEGAQEAGVGFVPAENLIGKAQVILFSWYPGASLWNPISWFSKVRFSRFFHPLH
jgi:signal peptidase I